jgi:hypothetical protein
MDHKHYRQEFASYNSAIQQALYKYYVGHELALQMESIHDRYDDLWRAETIQDLQTVLNQTALHFETERTALQNLINSIHLGIIEKQVETIENEIKRCESSAKISVRDTKQNIAYEKSANNRHVVERQLADALRPCDDLRIEKLEKLNQLTGTLGFESYTAFCSNLNGTDFKSLLNSASVFMNRTATGYRLQLSQLASQFIHLPVNELSHSDYLFLKQQLQFNNLFPLNAGLKSFISMLRDLGINIEQQNNLHIINNSRMDHHWIKHSVRFPITCNNIRLVIGGNEGLNQYIDLFEVGAEAQHLAWSSNTLTTQYPEFFYSPDNATNKGYGLLFGYLFQDPIWLTEHGGLSYTDAQRVVRTLAFINVYIIRRLYATFAYTFELFNNSPTRSDQLSLTYSELHKDATGFMHLKGMYLTEIDQYFQSAQELRAWTFAIGLREHLRTRYGKRWWTKQQARDDLIDLWNTASRYKVEELAQLIGFRELSFELLSEMLISAMNEGD